MYDCCLTKKNHWFRYRAAAIIIEDGKALFAGNENEDYYYSIGGGVLKGLDCHEVAFYFLMKPRGTTALNSNSYSFGAKEEMIWIPN